MDALVSLAVFAAVVWIGYLQVSARRPRHVICGLDFTEVEEEVRSCFHSSLRFTEVSGRGLLNYRVAIFYRPPTISIDFHLAPEGSGTVVSIWVSEWTNLAHVFMNGAFVAWRKKRALVARLAEATSRPTETVGE